MNFSEINIKKAFLHIIIPTFNASGTIKMLVNQLEKTLYDYEFKLILIDDASTDHTTSIIASLSKEYDNIRYHFSHRNQGQQASLQIGLSMLTTPCDYVITMDDDMQNPVEVVKKLIDEIQLGYDLVYAIPVSNHRSTKSGPTLMRRCGSLFRDILFHSFMNKPQGIKVSAFRIMTYDLAVKIASSRKKYFYLSAEAFQYEIKVSNIYYPFASRYSGRSSYNFRKLLIVYLRLLLTYKLKLFKWVK